MDILMYFIGQIFCQVIANENLETNSCLQMSVVPTAIHCKDCEIWIKALLNPKITPAVIHHCHKVGIWFIS